MAIKGKQILNWKCKQVKHGNYTDLGRYIIDFGEIDAEEFEKGVALANLKLDTLKTSSCTAIAKKNSKGQVIMGRNQDEDVSLYPVMISHLTGGKRQAVAFFYSKKFDYTYKQFQEGIDLPDGFRGMMASVATDAFNEDGLYIQTNMRTNVGIPSSGTNPGAERTPMIGLSSRVAMNCSTVAEALAYIKTLDVYTLGGTDNQHATWDYAYMIGDATGEYGILEFASNRMYYTPYANGHCNAFVAPELTGFDQYGAGFGRLAIGQQAAVGAETARDMMEAMHKGDWRREVEDFEYSYKDEQGMPHFVDAEGNPSIDWRSEFTMLFAVDDFGNYIPEDYTLSQYLDVCCNALTGCGLAKLLTGKDNPKVTKEMQETIDAVDALPGLAHELGTVLSPELQASIDRLNSELSLHYHANCTKSWLLDPKNFDTVKAAFRKFFEAQNAFELMDKFNSGDTQPLREAGCIFTTCMNFGVNCAEKYLVVRFLEDESAIYEYQW